ncbi:hypothetical protein Taro_014870 [Colocasia esculenta]|uniref:Transposase Tnp1/En/Spm-like domain-containing protein n=1 Tax=Colocasia esculenta TaxID=4460 RepID=A0A843UG17_COLES|nr:hypothetical protein [Colocasia esculenta]
MNLQKSGQDMDRSELFIVTHTRKDGIPVNSECAVAIEKIQALKQSQSSASSSQTVASKYDIYSQVLGEDKPSRVRGLGTRPTPATLWGRSTYILKDENKKLGDRVKDLEERIAKLERIDSKFQLTSKRVKLLDMYGSQVAIGIVMSTDPTKIVMGRPIGQEFCEVAVLLANKPDSPLFIKDYNRKIMKDAIESHILWFLEYPLAAAGAALGFQVAAQEHEQTMTVAARDSLAVTDMAAAAVGRTVAAGVGIEFVDAAAEP